MERETSVSGEVDGLGGEFSGELGGELEGGLCDSFGLEFNKAFGLEFNKSFGLEFSGSAGLDSVWDSVCGFLAGKTRRESKESWVSMGERVGEIRL